jgi:hypothetical protein
MRLSERVIVALTLIASVGVQAIADVESKRQTPGLLTCPAAATMNTDQLEMWQRIRASLQSQPSLGASEVLIARMLARPTSFPEWEVSIFLPKAGEARLTASIADRSVVEANHVRKNRTVILRSQPVLVKVEQYTTPITRQIGESIGRIWYRAIHASRMPIPQQWVSADGTTYFFSRWVQGEGEICGQIDEPIDGSIPAELKAVAKTLLELARAETKQREEVTANLQEKLELLESGLGTPSE